MFDSLSLVGEPQELVPLQRVTEFSDSLPRTAGVIHSDFERGFIKAEIVSYQDLIFKP